MEKQDIITFEKLREKVIEYIEDEKKIELISKAYLFAFEKHFGVKRLTGEDYIQHPLNVAIILTTINADAETICAALLHDVMEDCNTTEEEIKEKFDDEIASLVVGVTKINRLNFNLDSEASTANHRKIIVGLSQDVRVIIIKLADRLHNMRTLWIKSKEQQKETAKETLDILIPIAHRLGINQIKAELEDLSLRYSKPDVYFSIVENLNKTRKERDRIVEEMVRQVSKILSDHGIENKVKGRAKSIFGIYKKLDDGKKFKEIYDLMALRVFVDSESDCYQALGILHAKYKPVPKRFKDYVAMPKTNMYQSLHTTVFGLESNIFEIQIRTPEMDEIAEKGIASHWSYKEGGKGRLQTTMEQKLQFFRSIIELKDEETGDEEFVNSVKKDVFKDTIYVFTPKGDVVELPYGSTPIDFAYKVHSQVGDKMVSAIINDSIVTLDYKLQNQDIIKIKTNPNSSGPSREWIGIAKTTQAKNKIKSFFAKVDKERDFEKGEELIAKELRTHKIPNSEFFANENIEKILKHYKLTNVEELNIAVGSGRIPVSQVVKPEFDSETKEELILKKAQSGVGIKSVSKNDIIVRGMGDLKVNIASCCLPVLGDEIVGYITKGQGINIHRITCPNVKDLEERLIDVEWNKQDNQKYVSTLIVHASENHNLLLDIISKTSHFNISVKNFNEMAKKDDYVFEISVLVEDTSNLEKFMDSVNTIKNISRVERLMR